MVRNRVLIMSTQSTVPAPIIVVFAASSQQFSFKFIGGELLEACANWTSVFSRFTWGHPSNVVRSVRAINIDSIEQISWRARSNIGKKIRKFIPAFANFYTHCAIPLITGGVWIVATLAYSYPCSVERMCLSFSSVSMLITASSLLSTSAGDGVTASKFVCNSNMFFAAITLAKPSHFTMFVCADSLKRNQSSKSYICDIYMVGHRTVPVGSRSSSEAGAHTPASLRIITWS